MAARPERRHCADRHPGGCAGERWGCRDVTEYLTLPPPPRPGKKGKVKGGVRLRVLHAPSKKPAEVSRGVIVAMVEKKGKKKGKRFRNEAS